MKKKVILAPFLAAVFALTPALAACGGDHYTAIGFPSQDTEYTVTSQGGSAVSYGNYVYFLNGTRGYSDESGSSNIWNEVVKGAVYRAEYITPDSSADPKGEYGKYTDADGAKRFRRYTADNGLQFKYTSGTDYFDEPEDVVDVTPIASKTVGTSGYAKGGLFIYDNNLFFASPNNSKNSVGSVQTGRTDFFMMPLSGGKPTKLYTTSEGVDTSSSAYAFYKYAGAVHLVVNEGSSIVIVRVDTGAAKAGDPVKHEVDATSVYFPVRDTYYTGIDSNTAEDFIYFVRNVKTDSSEQKAGSVIEAMRPDGSEKIKLSMNGKTDTIEAVRDGILFYRTTNTTGTSVLAYYPMHDALMEMSESYRKHEESLPADKKTAHLDGGLFSANMSNITSAYPFRVEGSNMIYFVGATSSAISVYSTDGTSRRISSSTGTLQFMADNYIYYSGSGSDYHRAALWENMPSYGAAQELASATTTATFGCDYVDGYFTYFGKVDEWADGYMLFAKVEGRETVEDGVLRFEGKFIGSRAAADIPTDEQIAEAKGETTSDD